MKIFVPVSAQVPSSRGVARVPIRPTSDPACGSEMQIVAVHSPETSRGTTLSRRRASACPISSRDAARPISGSMLNAMHDPVTVSATPAWITSGNPCPPYCSGRSRPTQPASQ